MQLEFRHLKTVCAIAESGSLSRAASSLGLAQPALTAQLQRIEAAMGGALFERDSRGARPTPLGELVLARSRVLLPAVSELQHDARRLADSAGTLPSYRIGSVGVPFLTGLLGTLEADFPGALVSTHASWSANELATLAARGRVDYAIVGVCGAAAPPAVDGLAWETIATEPIFVLLAENHPCARQDEVHLAELAGMKWAVTPDDGCFENCFAAACAREGFMPGTIYEADIATCIDLARSEAAAVLCQPTFRQMEQLVAMPIAGIPLRWRHLLGWHSQSPAASLSKGTAARARAAYADTIDRNPRYPAWLRRHPEFDPLSR